MARVSPQRSPQGVSTYTPRHVLRDFPYLPNDFTIIKGEDFWPYRAGDYTVTQTNGTAVQASTNGGSVKLSTTGSTAADKVLVANTGSVQQFVPGNKVFFDTRLAISGAFSDTNMYCGLFDSVDPSAAITNAAYFIKPSGGTAVNFVISKAGVVTTFSNVADLAKPSGIFNDQNAVTAVLSFIPSGGNYAFPIVNTPGNGYRVAPLILATGATGANATLTAVLGGSGLNVQNPTSSTYGLPYAGIAAAIITNPGNAAYTTVTAEVDAWINLQLAYDGFGRLYVGVNGRVVLEIEGTASATGVTAVTAGQTYNLATSGVGPSFGATGTQLTTVNFSNVVPVAGDPINILPLAPMEWVTGFKNTTANARAMYVEEYNLATEFN
jgi:hypothetical protein